MRKYTYLFIVLFSCFIWLRPKTVREEPQQAGLVQFDSDVGCLHDFHVDGVKYDLSDHLIYPKDKIPDVFKTFEYFKTNEATLSRSLLLITQLFIVRIRGDGVLFNPFDLHLYKDYLNIIKYNDYG